ncbi:hypothetical protein D1007_29553 [Hordeum vulgare]|nr:hypothetical protein D1007_29553 [Hordeum vulgare]KAI4998570.1 hypothetical protein ZWY2020_053912 [Hordeum vulgare]
MGGIGGGRCWTSGLALLACAVLLSAVMANGIRTGAAGGMGAPGPAAAAAQTATLVAAPPVAAAETAPPSEGAAFEDPYKDSKRKVPNGPDPIHNRRARWGDAPAKRV